MPYRSGDLQRVGPPPLGTPAPLVSYLQVLADAINRMPRFSYFSGSTPAASNLSGLPGDVAINMGSASTSSRVWVKGSNNTIPNTTGWVVVRILE